MFTRESWNELEQSIYMVYESTRKGLAQKDFLPLLYNVQNSTKSQENHIGVGSIGQMAPWGGTISYQDIAKGYTQNYRHAKYSTGLQFEEEVIRFEEFNKIKKETVLLATAVHKTIQAHAIAPFNNAFDTNFTGPDGVALCSASHPLSPTNAAVQSNLGTLALTSANLNTTFNKMVDFVDDKGDPIGIEPNLLIVGNEYRDIAKKICKSALEPGTAENDINTWNDMNYLYIPGLRGKKWFLVDKTQMMARMNWYYARKPEMVSDKDFNTEIMSHAVIGMWSKGFDSYDFIFGNNVS